MKKAIIYRHGKGGSYLEAEQYKKSCLDYDVYGVDYHGYFPWIAKKDILALYDELSKKYGHIDILANSIGAYFAMHALQNCNIQKAMFISPILDMEQLILDMMKGANVSEEMLFEKGEISTDFGETLSWDYLCYVRENPIIWDIPTEILYAQNDHLTSRLTIDKFMKEHNLHLTVMENGNHWFHTREELAFLNQWLKEVVK